MAVDTVAVDRLLAESRAAHDRKKQYAGVVNAKGDVVSLPNWPVAERHIADALRLRLEAHAADPGHVSPGWSQDKASDRELIKFYVAYAKPFIPDEQMAQIVERYPECADIQYIP